MSKILVLRAWMAAVFLLLTAGVALSQMAPLPFQNTIAWGGPIQPDVGNSGNHAQPVPPTSISTETITGSSADGSESSSDNPAKDPDNTASPSTVDNSGSNTGSANPDNTVRQLGTPFPLQLQPEGLKIGPFYLTNISDSFFYAVNNVPGEPTQTYGGNSITANLVATKSLSNGVLAIQAREQMSIANSLQPFFNQSVGATFNDQLSERWSLNASAQFIYFQNSILANPQYLLSYQNGGIVQQTLFVQQRGSTMEESNSISLSYQLNGRTHVTLSPIVAATYIDQQFGWTSTNTFGGTVGVTRDFTPNLSLGAYYSLYHSMTSGVSGAPSWNGESLGVSFQAKFAQSWAVAGALAASGQLVGGVKTLVPVGSLTIMKSFGQFCSISGAYTRSDASAVLVSSGYYDQGDIGYNQRIGRKVSVNAGVGAFRTVNVTNYQSGKRVGGSLSYQWLPRLGLNVGYNFAHQSGTQTSTFFPLIGNTSYFNVGLTWTLGARSGL